MITWIVRCLLATDHMLIKGPNIYLSVSPFLPLLFFALDSFTHPLTCRNSTALYCSVPKVLRLLSGYFHLFHHPGFRHYFRFGCPKATIYYGLLYFRTPRFLPVFSFTFSSLQYLSLWIWLADPRRGTGRFHDKS